MLGGINIGSNAPTVSSSKVNLSAGSFKSNVSVASTNTYSFELDSGNYSQKTFTATSSADEINNYGSTVGIVSGKGNDSIYNYGENVSIDAGAGKDYIYNGSENVSISSGAGNDSITNDGNYATIATGAGNDSITNNADSIRVQYSGGNDVIEGFGLTDTLQLSSDTITSAYYDGTDAFITVGENTITLKNLSESRINLMNPDDTVSSEYVIPVLKGTNNADDLTNANANLIIQALAADDTIANSGASITVEGGADNDLINNSSDAIKSLLLGQAGDDTISNDAENVTISGGDGQDSIGNWGSNVSINGGVGDDSVEIDNCSNVTVDVGEGNDTIGVGSNVPSFTVQNFTAGDRIQLQVAATALTSTKGGIKIDDDLTIKGNLTASNTTNQFSLKSGVATYYQSVSAGVTLTDNNTALVYTAGGSSDIFTISGVTSTKGITVDDNMVTISAAALGTSNVSISENYYLVLGEDVASPEQVNEGWHINGTTATYRDVSTLAGYTLDDNQIIYSAPTYGKTFVELKGVSLPADGEGVILSNSIVLTPANFASNVTVSNNDNGYDFELDEGDYSGKTFVGTSGGDFINNNYGSNVIIDSGAGNDTIDNSGSNATITTGKGDDSIYTRSYGQNVKVSAGAGNDSIDNDASYASIDAGAGADYITNSGYSSIFEGGAGNDSIINNNGMTYNTINGGAGKDYISNWGSSSILDGGAGADSIENYSDDVIINGGADNDSIYNASDNTTINGGTGDDYIELYLSNDIVNHIEYNAGDGNDVVTMTSGGAKILVDLLSGSIGGYSTTEENDLAIQIDDGSLTFKNASGELISIGTSADENHIFNGISNTTIGGGDGTNIIDNKGSYVTVQSGSGNDAVTISEDEYSYNTFAYVAGKGNDTVYNYGSNDTIKITDDSRVKVKVKNDDVILKVGTSSVTLADAAANKQMITVVNSKDETIISDIYTTAGKINFDATAIELAENFTGTYTAEENMTTVDGSNVRNGIEIIGNEVYSNSLIGGKGNDTLGGELLDDTLTGGKGKDVFVYKGGSDVITDYERKDKIKLENSSSLTSYAIADKDLILGFGSDSLTIASYDAGKVISFVEGKKTTRYIYTTTGILDGKEKSVSLSGAESTFSAARYSKLVTIDGSNAIDYMNITGNSKKNYIIGGGFGGTMTGGKGKDSLIASEGSDVFIYEKGGGKDVIEGYGAGDVVNIGSDVTIKDAKIKKGNSEIKVAGGSITINDTKTATLNFGGNDVYFDNGAFIDRTNSVVKVYGSYKDDIELSSLGVTIADASDARRKLTITGDGAANSITGGKGKDKLYGGEGDDSLIGGKGKDSLWGGAGNDTLAGGKGNDLLYGDAGTDTFIFTAGDGVDTVAGYESGELLSIINKRGKAVDVSKSIFNEGKGTLTLSVKGGGKLILTEVTSSTSVNINGTSKRISAL